MKFLNAMILSKKNSTYCNSNIKIYTGKRNKSISLYFVRKGKLGYMNKHYLFAYVIQKTFIKLFSVDYFIKTLKNVSSYCYIINDIASACKI